MIWKICSLSDVCSVFNGSTPSRKNKEYWENGSINWFTIEDIRKFGRIINKTTQYVTEKALKETGLKLIPINSVLLCCTASVGEYAITKIPLTMNQQFNALIPNKNELLPEFLFYYCSTIKKKLISASGTTTFDFISAGKLKKIKISYPPLPIQEKIVAKLDKIFAEIDKATAAAEAYISNSESLFQAYLENIFNCNKNWTEYKLSQLCENFKQDIVDGPFGSNLKKKDFINEGIPILKIQNIKEGEILKKNINFVTYEKYNSIKRHSFIKGDIVMTKLGNPLGVSAIVNNFDYGLIVADLVRIRAKKVNTEFLCYQLNSRKIKNFINSQQKGSTRPRVTLKIIRELPINIPNKIDHQLHVLKSINYFIKQTRNIIQLSNSKIIELNKLKQSILRQAFNGELVKAA